MLAALAGYLCCLSSFEWSLLWDFAPYRFRPWVALLLTLGFVTVMALHQVPRERRTATTIPALAWLALSGWPLRWDAVTATVVFSGLSLVLLLAVASPIRAGFGLLVSLVMALSLLAGTPLWPVAFLVCALVALEHMLTSPARQEWMEKRSQAEIAKEESLPTVEISWKGFASLFKAAVPGEGERFVTTLLADTSRIIEGCGGRRVRGSDLNGVYRFQEIDELERCLESLDLYRNSVTEVLEQAEAPLLKLVVKRAEGHEKEPSGERPEGSLGNS